MQQYLCVIVIPFPLTFFRLASMRNKAQNPLRKGGPKPQRQCRGPWKQLDVVTKSTQTQMWWEI